MNVPVRKSTPDLRFLLSVDHLRLERCCRELEVAVNAHAGDEIPRAWKRLATGVRAHFELEEKLVFPEFQKVDPTEVEALTRQHSEIRTAIDQLCAEIDRKIVPAPMVAKLLKQFKAHVKREKALLYRWADANLRQQQRHAIVAQLNGSP